MTARDRFNGIDAELWDGKDSDRLIHLDPISALEDLIGSRTNRASPMEDQIRELGPVSIEAYRRAAITPQHIDDAVDAALEEVRQSLEEDAELGDPEDGRPMFPVDVLAKHRPAFESAVRELTRDASVWACELVTSVELTPEEALEILRVERPEWFEPAPAEAT